jgi:hypothetical protein
MGGAGSLGMDCECHIGFVYKRGKITSGSSNNGGGLVVGLLCVE